MGTVQTTSSYRKLPNSLQIIFYGRAKMKFVALLLIAAVFVCVSCEDKKPNAETKMMEKTKDLVKDEKRAMDLAGGNRQDYYYGTSSGPCRGYASFCHSSSQCCGSLICRYNAGQRDYTCTSWSHGTTRQHVSYEQYKENKEEAEAKEDQKE